MKTRFVPFGTAAILIAGLISGCTETAPVGPERLDVSVNDQFAAYRINMTELDRVLEEVPVFDAVMMDSIEAKVIPGEVTPVAAEASVYLSLNSYARVFMQMNLSVEQRDHIMKCFVQQRDCALDASRNFVMDRRMMQDSMIQFNMKLHADVQAGLMKEDQAARLRMEYMTQFYARMGTLGGDLRRDVESCMDGLDACATSVLTPEQVQLWNHLKLEAGIHPQ